MTAVAAHSEPRTSPVQPMPLAKRTFPGLVAVFLVLAVAGQSVTAQCPSLRPQDTFWSISTRHLGCPSSETPDLHIRRYDDGWRDADMAEFLDAGSLEAITCITVQAARADSSVTVSRGFDLYHCLARRTDAPLRFVVWLWPTPSTVRVVRDFRVSYEVMDRHAYYLGWFLTQMPAEAQVSLIGFSMGASVIAGGLHVAAGGSLAGQELPGDGGPSQTRVVLWSAAFHNYWLSPESHYGRSMSRVDHMYLLVNSLDPVLKRYRLVEHRSHARALGYTGLACVGEMGSDRNRITQVNGRRSLGRHHEYDRHMQAGAILGPSLRCLLWQPADEIR